jgi:gluconate kinase
LEGPALQSRCVGCTSVDAVVLIGAPGSGKSSVLGSLTTVLQIDGILFGAIESEQLSWGSPLLSARDWIPQLAAVLAMQRDAGRQTFLVAATPETADELRAIVAATEADKVLVVCLAASAETVAARLDVREPDHWPEKRRLIAHARTLAASIPTFSGIDLTIDTEERRAEDVAAEIYAAMRSGGFTGR